MRTLISFFFILIFTSLQILANPISNEIHKDEETILSVEMKDKKVWVSWEKSPEGTYYEIEYSTNGKDFETIATGEDITSMGQGLYFVDNKPGIENYYRLMSITPEGEITYSEVIYISPLPLELTLEGLK